MAFVLLLPMNAKAQEILDGGTIMGDYIIDDSYICYNDLTVLGDLYISSQGSLMLSSKPSSYPEINVAGSVYVDGELYLTGGDMYVEEDFVLMTGYLYMDACTLDISGDYRVQDINSYGEYIKGSGAMHIENYNAQIIVRDDICVDTSANFNTFAYTKCAKITAYGDVIFKSVSSSSYSEIYLCMKGSGKQILNTIGKVHITLELINSNVELKGCLNAELSRDIVQYTLDDGILEVGNLSLNGYKMNVPGTLVTDGYIYIDSGSLTVEEDYIQTAGCLYTNNGTLDVKGNLRIQGLDENAEYISGTGDVEIEEGGLVSVGKDLCIDTSKSMKYKLDGKITVAGNIEQISTADFCPAYVVMNGTDKQKITFSGENSVIDTLELMQVKKEYTFNPEPCWNNLIESGGSVSEKEDEEQESELSGLVNTANGFLYYEDGEWISDAYKFVKYGSGKFLVANGRVATHINGLAQDPDNKDDWYFLSGGQVQDYYTGLAQYDGEWFYVTNGKLDTTRAGFVYYDGGWFYVGAGRIMSEVNGLAKDPDMNRWYYLACGQAQTDYSGLAQYDGKWFYIISGILAENYTGRTFYDGQYFNVVNGMVK